MNYERMRETMRLENMPVLLESASTKVLMKDLYGTEKIAENTKRYEHVAKKFVEEFGKEEFEFFSAPGRTEIGGNHTDHNHGKVLAGSIQLDCVAAANKNDSDVVNIISETYNQHLQIKLEELEPSKEHAGTPDLLKGILAGFVKEGFNVGGFDAYVTTNVIGAAGVSSSASFEMLVCCILDYLFNETSLSIVDYAKVGKFSENVYWNKQSGLLDQMGCASGGIVAMDFKNPDQPVIEKIDFSFDSIGYDLIIVNTGKGHADLSAEYSAVPIEMKKAAAYFGKETLSEVSKEEFISNIAEIRKTAGDRAILRALHFFTENERVEQQVTALKNKNYDEFLRLITASGNSSWKWLQNCYSLENFEEQSVTVALSLTELYLENIKKGACRVHGGGFAGVILTLLPKEYTEEYTKYMEDVLGEGNVYVMNIRKYGAIHMGLKEY